MIDGDRLDVCLYRFARSMINAWALQRDANRKRRQSIFTRMGERSILCDVGFDPTRKMSTFVLNRPRSVFSTERGSTTRGPIQFLKGALEHVLPLCEPIASGEEKNMMTRWADSNVGFLSRPHLSVLC